MSVRERIEDMISEAESRDGADSKSAVLAMLRALADEIDKLSSPMIAVPVPVGASVETGVGHITYEAHETPPAPGQDATG